jgi:hypothetical protein
MYYYQCKVQFVVEENGKLKKKAYNYLVNAMSVTEAEARVTEWLTSQGEQEFEVKSATNSSIIHVIE